MKKVTLFLFIFGCFLSLSAQHVFDVVPGPINVPQGTPPTLSINDLGNSAAAPASSSGSYNSFLVTVDWTAGGGNPWSIEADLTVTTTAGSITIDPPTTGGAFSGAATSLTFEGDLAGIYDPTTDGLLEITLNQSFGGSAANWSNITVTIFESPTCVSPSGMMSDGATTTSIDLTWNAGDAETAWNIEYNGGADFTPGNGEEEGSASPTGTPSTSLTGLTEQTNYFLYYQADCGGGDTSEWVGPFNFITGYCESIPSSNDGQGILDAQLGTQNFTSAGDVTFEDFRSPTVDLAAGVTANFIITFATGFTYDVNVWIDFNNDLVYDNATELVFQGETTNINPTTFDASFVMPNVPLGVYNMRMGSADFGQSTPNPCFTGSFGVTADFTVNVTAAPECVPASSLIAENITETTADLSWNDLTGTGVTWDLEWGPAGFTPGSGTAVNGLTTTNFSLTGLTAGTAYDYYILTNCASTSSTLSGPSNFITATPGETCANAFPMTVETNCDGTNSVTFNFANGGDIDANDENPTCDGFGNFGYFVSFAAPAIGSVIFYFDGAADNIGLEVYDACGGTPVSDCANNSFDAGDNSGIIGGLTPGATYVAVIWRDSASGTADVCIEAGPSCPQPIDLNYSITSADSVELGWTEIGIATMWNVEYGPVGFTQGTGTLISDTMDNPVAVSGLTAQTPYDFYVQSNCGGETSNWSGPFEFIIDYCESVPTSNDGSGVNITTINAIDFPSLGDVTYEDQTSPVIDVFPGVNTTVIIEFGHVFTYNTNIWIDFNDNFTFEPSELVFQGNSSGAGNPHTLDASFVMPVTATPGVHRMRIGSADFGQATPNPCFGGSFGVTLDFTVNVGILPCVLPEVSFNVVDDCDNQQFFVDVDITDLGDATSLLISTDFDANTIQVTAPNLFQLGPYPSLTTVNISVANEQESLCTIVSPPFQVVCPPPNDTPCEATVAVVNDGFLCESSTPGSIFGALPSGVTDPSCGGNPDDDIWFQFVAENEFYLIALANISGSTTTDIDHTLYEGTCDNLTEIACTSGFAELSSFTPQLTIGNTYYIRVYSGGSDAEDTTFDLCITANIAPQNVDCESTENLCSSGDEDNIIYYNNIVSQPNTSNLECLGTIPNPTYFEVPIGSSGDILLEMVQNAAFDAAGNPIGDELDVDFLLWGPMPPDDPFCINADPFTISAPVVDCSYSAAPVENAVLLGAQEGETYLLLITNFEDEAGVIQVRQTNLGDPGSGTIVAELEAQITSDEVFIDPNNDPETVSLCGFTQITLQTDSPGADEFIWFKNGFEIPGETSSTLTVNESDSYQVLAIDNGCAAQAFSQVVIVNFYDDPGNVDPISEEVCDDPGGDGTEEFDLDAIAASLGFGPEFTISFYTNTADANQAINAVSSPYSSTGETLIIRIEDTDAANNGFLGCRELSEVDLVVLPPPVVGTPNDLETCSALSSAEFTLTDNDAAILNGADLAEVTLTYHNSLADADNGVAPIASPYIGVNAEVIYARLENNTTGCYNTTSFNLIINAPSHIAFSQDIEECDDNDGVLDDMADFDLDAHTSVVLDGQDPASYNVTYHSSQEDAESNIGALPGLYTSGSATIYVRVEDILLPDCYVVNSFDLVVLDEVTATVNTDVFYYDSETNEFLLCPEAESGVELTIIPGDFTAAEVTIEWLIDDAVIPGESGLSLQVLEEGDYSAIITLNATGCSFTLVMPSVIEFENCVIPQGISPGVSIGQNDTFDLRYFNVTKLQIFNRNGTLVYSKDNYRDEWVGQTDDGDELPVGTYFYTMIFEDGTKTRTGWIYINR